MEFFVTGCNDAIFYTTIVTLSTVHNVIVFHAQHLIEKVSTLSFANYFLLLLFINIFGEGWFDG